MWRPAAAAGRPSALLTLQASALLCVPLCRSGSLSGRSCWPQAGGERRGGAPVTARKAGGVGLWLSVEVIAHPAPHRPGLSRCPGPRGALARRRPGPGSARRPRCPGRRARSHPWSGSCSSSRPPIPGRPWASRDRSWPPPPRTSAVRGLRGRSRSGLRAHIRPPRVLRPDLGTKPRALQYLWRPPLTSTVGRRIQPARLEQNDMVSGKGRGATRDAPAGQDPPRGGYPTSRACC